MRRISIGLVLALIALPAWAQTQEQSWCDSPTATDDQTIEGCTAQIQSGQLTTNNLAAEYNNRGFAYVNKGQYDEAIADFNTAVGLNPNYSRSYTNRGAVYFHWGLYDQAMAEDNKAIALQPDFADAYFNRGLVYEKQGQRDQAITDYLTSLRLNPGDSDTIKALNRLGVTP